jgi:adenylate kinase family enzyme
VVRSSSSLRAAELGVAHDGPRHSDDAGRRTRDWARAARRWLILGAGGAGKSRLAADLGEALGLPVVHLDRHFWRAGWIEPPRSEWRAQVEELCRADEWIMDGNYSGTLEARLPRAEVAVLLDPPVWTCLDGVLRRSIGHMGEVRPDMAEGCAEHLPDRVFLWYVVSYKWRSRPRVLRRIADAPRVRLVHLRSRGEAAAFVDALRAPRGS